MNQILKTTTLSTISGIIDTRVLANGEKKDFIKMIVIVITNLNPFRFLLYFYLAFE